MSEPAWVDADQVEAIHQALAEQAGVTYILKDGGLLEFACQRPFNAWAYSRVGNLFDLAVLLMMGIALNHPFTDGNKRAGFMAAILFLEFNGIEIEMEDDVAFADLMIDVISRKASEEELVDWLKRSEKSDLAYEIERARKTSRNPTDD